MNGGRTRLYGRALSAEIHSVPYSMVEIGPLCSSSHWKSARGAHAARSRSPAGRLLTWLYSGGKSHRDLSVVAQTSSPWAAALQAVGVSGIAADTAELTCPACCTGMTRVDS